MRTVIVTGATSGIGRETATRLLARGDRVVATGRRQDRLQALQERFTDTVRTVEADLAVPGAAAAIVSEIPAGWQVDTLIHAAGHDAGGGTPFHESDAGGRIAKLGVNLTSLAELTQALLPSWLARDAGDLVAVGSIAAREAVAGLTEYAMTKRGIGALLAGLRIDYADTGLRFTEIVPGVVRTGFAAGRWDGDEARSAGFYERFPQCLEAGDVAEAILWALDRPAHVAADEIVLRPTRR